MRKRHCSRCLYTEIKSVPIPAQDPPVPMAGGSHCCSLHPPLWFSLGTALRMQLPHPEPGAILLVHVPVPGNNSGNGQAVGVLLPRMGGLDGAQDMGSGHRPSTSIVSAP